MIPRKRLDIGLTDVFCGIGHCLWPGNRDATQREAEKTWMADGACLVSLSVRSGFDALLTALDFPRGGEVIVSCVTIRDMPRIIAEHGLVPVPVELEMRRLSVNAEALSAAVTPKTKAILAAHLFGSRMPMDPIVEVARRHGLLVFEDCAQAYDAGEYRGHPGSDVSMFSFGAIKTATALGGGILRFKDSSLRDRVRACQSAWPLQTSAYFLKRLSKYFFLVLLGNRAIFSLFILACRILGASHDRIINSSVRGFAGEGFFEKIRRQPSYPLLALLRRRLLRYKQERVADRMRLAQIAIRLMPKIERPGAEASFHTHWVFPIEHDTPDDLMRYLWSRGFDASRGTSSMYVVEPPADRSHITCPDARKTFTRALYLPVYEGLKPHDIERLAQAVQEFAAAKK